MQILRERKHIQQTHPFFPVPLWDQLNMDVDAYLKNWPKVVIIPISVIILSRKFFLKDTMSVMITD